MSTGICMSLTPNYFSPLEFQISIKRLPHVEFFTQQTSIPSISTNPVVQPTRFNTIWQTPDQVTFSTLDLSFIVDEDMQNYMEIFNWMISSAFPETHEQHKKLSTSAEGLFSDIDVRIMNSKKNSNILVSYVNCFPISLGDVQLNTTESDVTYPQVTTTFQYDRFSIKKLT